MHTLYFKRIMVKNKAVYNTTALDTWWVHQKT